MEKQKESSSEDDKEKTNNSEKRSNTTVKFSKNTRFNDSQSKLEDNDGKFNQY